MNKADLFPGEGRTVLVLYLVKRVLEQKCQKLHHRELGVGLNSS